MNLGRVYAIVLRYLYGIPSDVPRLFDIFFWPLVDLFVWGFLTVYLAQARGGAYVALSWLIGGIIFWTLLYRASQDVAVQLLEDIWARNFLNLFASPLRLSEFIAALLIVTLLKVLVTFAIISAIAFVGYAFDVFALGLYLLPFVGVLFLFGWALGLVVAALIVRYGSRVQIFAWGAAFLIQPISAVFYPVDILPPALIPLARINPATYVFEGMRAVLLGGSFPAAQWLLALGLSAGTLALSVWLFVALFDQARARGMLARLD
ncbi:MAG TPA: ABC transporter permease [Chloroflexota bacterium]|jgi:ABC-2 type transport system permease protein